MIGQGCPVESSRAELGRWLRVSFWLWSAFALAFAMPAEGQADEVALRLRISWGGGADRQWQGAVSIDGGSFSKLHPLGIESDSPGSIWLDGGSAIGIQQPSPRAYDGIDVSVSANAQARLTIQLAPDGAISPQNIDIPLAELLDVTHTSKLDETGNRLSVCRAPGDHLRVDFERSHLVFAPGEAFSFRVAPLQIEANAANPRLQLQIINATTGQRVLSEEHVTGPNGEQTPLTINTPQQEGVYELSIAVVPPSKIKQRLGLQKPILQRIIQFVVAASEPVVSAGEAPTAKVLEINPVNSRWWERFGSLSQIPGFRKGPLGNGDAAVWDHPTLGPMIQLGPGGTAPDMSWEAYPLPVDQPGQVHILELEYPSDVPQTMGISILEPNAAGAVMPIGLDSGVYVSDEEAANAPTMAKHRVVFWPRTKTPVVLITNRRPGSRAIYGKIAVYRAPQGQLSVLALGRSENSGALPIAFNSPAMGDRLWAGYMARPLVPENFGAPEALDGQSNRSLDDWNTFYQGSIRLVRYLEHVGYNGLMLSVLADGSSLYPSNLISPTPRYDTGTFFATGQDPVRKDVLELLFRLFDREQLQLIPALLFASPLPELESLKRTGKAESMGIEWVGGDGLVPVASAGQATVPYYNLLDSRVQSAMLNVIRELVGRYAAHSAFGGIALQLSPESFAQLPGADWGLDDRTIARFERETSLKVPGNGSSRFSERATYLSGPGREDWLRWRTQVVSQFHHEIEKEIHAAHAGAKLYLAGGTMLENRQAQMQLRPALPRRAKLDEALEEAGLALENYEKMPNIVVLRPQLMRPSTGPPPAGAAEAEVYQSREMDSLFTATKQRGSLFYHDPQKARLASFDKQSPFGPENTYAWLVSQMSPSGQRNRRRFVHALATNDTNQIFDGGWLLPLGQEASLKSLIRVYRDLPSATFDTVAGEFQPITIRMLRQGSQTIVYLVNDSSWPASVTLQLGLPSNCQVEKIGESEGIGPLSNSTGNASWQVSLQPYDLVAAKFTSPDLHIKSGVVSLPPGVREGLERRIEDLVARVRALGIPLLENPGFDLPLVNQQIAGWAARVPAGGRVLIDSGSKHSGSRSVMLATTGPVVSLTSESFPPPHTGRLTVEVWLRATGGEQRPSVLIALEGDSSTTPFAPHGVIERVGNSSGDWVPYSFPVENVPVDGINNLRVKFELLGPGEVWIDDAQVRLFSGTELIELSKLNSLASLHLEKGQYADCARLLEGYWPQFLVANVPLTTANTPVAQRPRQIEPQAREPERSPSMFETMRSYLPSILR